mmetsp:Transcript_9413/g.14194  ORF Transcript_9413/g.14194 Transcript_9413/m.14194 type:complete len:528 (-) Transcript_9413:55-1638(-)
MISIRWALALLLHSGIAIEYCLRVNMSVAAVQIKQELGWSDHQKGLMLSAFYWGYTLGQIPSNFLVKRYGPKLVFGWCILISSILTLFQPMACYYSFDMGWSLRAFIGLTASATFPGCFEMWPKWIHECEKTIMITIIMSGMYLGEVICFSSSGYLVTSQWFLYGIPMGSWPSAFWVFAVAGILWYPLWMEFSSDTPDSHPYISREELVYIQGGLSKSQSLMCDRTSDTTAVKATRSNSSYEEELELSITQQYSTNTPAPLRPSEYQLLGTEETKSYTHSDSLPDDSDYNTPHSEISRRVPWAAFFRHPTAWTLFFVYWCQNWIAYTMLSELPSYLTEVLGFDLASAGMLSVAPYVANFLSAVGFGMMFNRLQAEGWSNRQIRQTAQQIAFVGSCACLVLCGFVQSPGVTVALMVLAMALFGASQSGVACAFLEVTPIYSSTLNTIANLFGSLAGIVTPMAVSFLTTLMPKHNIGWKVMFLFTTVQSVVALILWHVYQTSNVVPILNSPRPKKTVQYKEWFPWFRYE